VKTHRFDPISLLFGVAAVVAGFAAINSRLGNLINNRPDALIPLLLLGIGVLAMAVAARRSLQDVDGSGHDQHDGPE
jgi:4-hydroxybenzoate polyprenyltransferase